SCVCRAPRTRSASRARRVRALNGGSSPFSLSDQTHSHGLVRCRSDRDRGSPAFVKFDDVRIKPGTILDIFPGEQFVIARGNGFEAEFAGLAGPRSFEKVDPVTAAWYKHDAAIWNRLTFFIAHSAC